MFSWFRKPAPPRPRPADISSSFLMSREQLGFFSQEWWENDCLKELRNRARQKGIDITGRRITYQYDGLVRDDPTPKDVVMLTVTVHG